MSSKNFFVVLLTCCQSVGVTEVTEEAFSVLLRERRAYATPLIFDVVADFDDQLSPRRYGGTVMPFVLQFYAHTNFPLLKGLFKNVVKWWLSRDQRPKLSWLTYGMFDFHGQEECEEIWILENSYLFIKTQPAQQRKIVRSKWPFIYIFDMYFEIWS